MASLFAVLLLEMKYFRCPLSTGELNNFLCHDTKNTMSFKLLKTWYLSVQLCCPAQQCPGFWWGWLQRKDKATWLLYKEGGSLMATPTIAGGGICAAGEVGGAGEGSWRWRRFERTLRSIWRHLWSEPHSSGALPNLITSHNMKYEDKETLYRTI